jgi:hypothetical protein
MKKKFKQRNCLRRAMLFLEKTVKSLLFCFNHLSMSLRSLLSSGDSPTFSGEIPPLSKYEKMRSILPDSVIRQKMNLDGVPDDITNNFFNNLKSNENGSATGFLPVSPHPSPPPPKPPLLVDRKSPVTPPPPPPFKSINASESHSDTEKFSKYEKMRRMLPEGAVRQRMNSDGFSVEEIDLFLNSPMSNAPIPSPPPRDFKIELSTTDPPLPPPPASPSSSDAATGRRASTVANRKGSIVKRQSILLSSGSGADNNARSSVYAGRNSLFSGKDEIMINTFDWKRASMVGTNNGEEGVDPSSTDTKKVVSPAASIASITSNRSNTNSSIQQKKALFSTPSPHGSIRSEESGSAFFGSLTANGSNDGKEGGEVFSLFRKIDTTPPTKDNNGGGSSPKNVFSSYSKLFPDVVSYSPTNLAGSDGGKQSSLFENLTEAEVTKKVKETLHELKEDLSAQFQLFANYTMKLENASSEEHLQDCLKFINVNSNKGNTTSSASSSSSSSAAAAVSSLLNEHLSSLTHSSPVRTRTLSSSSATTLSSPDMKTNSGRKTLLKKKTLSASSLAAASSNNSDSSLTWNDLRQILKLNNMVLQYNSDLMKPDNVASSSSIAVSPPSSVPLPPSLTTATAVANLLSNSSAANIATNRSHLESIYNSLPSNQSNPFSNSSIIDNPPSAFASTPSVPIVVDPSSPSGSASEESIAMKKEYLLKKIEV